MKPKCKELTYNEVDTLAKVDYNRPRGNLKRFNGTIAINHQDGSHFMWNNAFAMKKDDWIVVFTEHFGYHIFHCSDIDGVMAFNHQHKDLKSL